jgi:flagellar hook assembly protein FlgD
MDNAEFMQQLSQLRALESQNNMQKSLDDMNKSFASTVDAQKASAQAINNAASVSLIGKEVCIRQTGVRYHATANESVPIRVHLGDAEEASVELLDSDGKVIKTLQATGKDAENSAVVNWDGAKEDGTHAKAGTYSIHIVGEENNTALYAFVQGAVSGIRYDSTGALAKINGQEIPVANIMDVSPDAENADGGSLAMSTAVQLIGKLVRLRQDDFYYSGMPGEQKTINVFCDSLPQATVRILDAQGQTVRILPAAADDNGYAQVAWDGKGMDEGTTVDPGYYSIRIDESSIDPAILSYQEGTVDGVSTVDGSTKLRVNGALVPLSSILDISTQGGAA